jgi:hypothetical protein
MRVVEKAAFTGERPVLRLPREKGAVFGGLPRRLRCVLTDPIGLLGGILSRTPSLSGGPQETAPRIAKKRTLWAVRSELMLGHANV